MININSAARDIAATITRNTAPRNFRDEILMARRINTAIDNYFDDASAPLDDDSRTMLTATIILQLPN